jgi:hypothetical protein
MYSCNVSIISLPQTSCHGIVTFLHWHGLYGSSQQDMTNKTTLARNGSVCTIAQNISLSSFGGGELLSIHCHRLEMYPDFAHDSSDLRWQGMFLGRREIGIFVHWQGILMSLCRHGILVFLCWHGTVVCVAMVAGDISIHTFARDDNIAHFCTGTE